MAEGSSDTKLQQEKCVPRYDWYQTDTSIVITVLIKNVKEEQLNIETTPVTISITIKDYAGKDIIQKYTLAHEINNKSLNYHITPSKIEIKLLKIEGIRWDTLEGDPTAHCPKVSKGNLLPDSGPPSYPTSRKGKDWSAIEKDMKQQEANEKPEGEEALNKLFQDIYGKGSDEVKRAMNKSYMESGGTVLSTNWKEISQQKVEVKPPDGMEWKKW